MPSIISLQRREKTLRIICRNRSGCKSTQNLNQIFFIYRKISNTIRTLVQYAPQTITGKPWENVSLAVQYAPVLCHPSPSPSLPSMPSATSTKGVSCSVAGAGKVTLIGSNCPASRVGRCVDCEGGRMAQIFSDCASTKYLIRATARRPCSRHTIAAVETLHSCYCLAASTHSSPAE